MLQTERMPDLVEVMRMGKDHRLKHRQLPLQVDENLTVSPGFTTRHRCCYSPLLHAPKMGHPYNTK